MTAADWCWCGNEEVPVGQCDGCDFGPLHDDEYKCGLCNGRGTVNPLTPNLPDDFLCLSTTTCPACDGSGQMD